MASNPMQRKANMYLLIGVVVTLLITGSIIGILAMQYVKLQQDIDTEHKSMKAVTVLKKDVNSGDVVKESDVTTVKVVATAAPADTIKTDIFSPVSVVDENGNEEEEVKVEYISKLNLKAGTILTD